MSQAIQLEMPGDLAKFRLPKGVHQRLQALLDRQDQGCSLTPAEKREAKGLVELVEMLSAAVAFTPCKRQPTVAA